MSVLTLSAGDFPGSESSDDLEDADPDQNASGEDESDFDMNDMEVDPQGDSDPDGGDPDRSGTTNSSVKAPQTVKRKAGVSVLCTWT